MKEQLTIQKQTPSNPRFARLLFGDEKVLEIYQYVSAEELKAFLKVLSEVDDQRLKQLSKVFKKYS